MKITYMSDLHLEFGHIKQVPEEGDVLVLAGDIDVSHRFEDRGVRHWMYEQTKRFNHVIFVIGNHEYYNGNFDQVKEMFKKNASHFDNFHYLQDESVIIDNVKFVGCTWWTSLSNNNPIVKMTVQQEMNDYRIITRHNRRLIPDDTVEEHVASSTFLEQQVENGCVVVTHHAPSQDSALEIYQGTKLNYSFCNNWDFFVEEMAPKLWIHGHCHSSSDYMIGNTRVLCNPRGYVPHELNPLFNINASVIL